MPLPRSAPRSKGDIEGGDSRDFQASDPWSSGQDPISRGGGTPSTTTASSLTAVGEKGEGEGVSGCAAAEERERQRDRARENSREYGLVRRIRPTEGDGLTHGFGVLDPFSSRVEV